MRSPHEGPTASRFGLRIPRGPRKFVAASLAIDILSMGGAFQKKLVGQNGSLTGCSVTLRYLNAEKSTNMAVLHG